MKATSRGIACPYCGGRDIRTTDSRSHNSGLRINRRRQCECGFRFSTQEIAVERGMTAVAVKRADLTDAITDAITERLRAIVSVAVNQIVMNGEPDDE